MKFLLFSLGDSPPPTIDVDVADASPLVEEPDDEEDDARLMMSEELRQYINLMKQEKLLPSRFVCYFLCKTRRAHFKVNFTPTFPLQSRR